MPVRRLRVSASTLLLLAIVSSLSCNTNREKDNGKNLGSADQKTRRLTEVSLEKRTASLDLREPMALGASAIVRRLDPDLQFRPWFLLRGSNGVPTSAEHASWDLGDMTGRYLESLIQTRRMGVLRPEFVQAEARLQRFMLSILGPDGLVHDPSSGAIDHSFSQGSALFGLLAWFEDTGDPAVRRAVEKLISAQLKRAERHEDLLVDPSAKLEQASGSHLAGYQIWPIVRFYELTGYPDALELAEGLTRWAMNDPVIGPEGQITKALSWEGHIHSWLETMSGCARTARNSSRLDRRQILAKCRGVYDWVRRTNATSFGWIATYPTGGSSETCAIGSAIRLALELAEEDRIEMTRNKGASKSPASLGSSNGSRPYLDDVERFVRNQIIAAQFRDLQAYRKGTNEPTPLLLGCFDSQSMPNGHLGTRGGEDVGTVEGCCLNGGMRALALAWDSSQVADETGVTVNLAITRSGPAADVVGYQPREGRVDVVPRAPGKVRVRVPDWAAVEKVKVSVDDKQAEWGWDGFYVAVQLVQPGQRVSVRYPLRELEEKVVAGGQDFKMTWRGDVITDVKPKGGLEPGYGIKRPATRAPTHENRGNLADETNGAPVNFPDEFWIQDAARLAGMSMLARMDLSRDGQPFFRIYPFATPPRAEHEKWDDGDMTGRYVEALIYSRRLTGCPIESREPQLRRYLASLFDRTDGLCYARATEWTPRRACLFSQSSAMLGLLAWYRDTGSLEARALLDKHVAGVIRIARESGNAVWFPKYEYDGKGYVDDPPGKDAPIWYGGRLILPLVEYYQITESEEVKVFLEKMVRYCVEVSHFIKPDGAVERGEAWWGHLHGTMDMAAGIAEFGRLTGRPDLVEWAKRVYDWIGRTHTTRYGWVADVSGGTICESCGISSRFRLGLELYKAGAADPFGEMDRHLRNQLRENQFVDVSFLKPLEPGKTRTERCVYEGIDRMIRGTFQCWGTANDLIGNDDIEGCGAGGGVQGLMLASEAQSEWRTGKNGAELRIHLLFNRVIRGQPEPPLTVAPAAARLYSFLPHEGRAQLQVFQNIPKAAIRVPDGSDPAQACVSRRPSSVFQTRPSGSFETEGRYVIVNDLKPGEILEVSFPLPEYETTERAAGVQYQVKWKGSSVLSISPSGKRVPLYADRARLSKAVAPLSAPRYPN